MTREEYFQGYVAELLNTVVHSSEVHSKKMADSPVPAAGGQFPDGDSDTLVDRDTQAVLCVTPWKQAPDLVVDVQE